MERIYLINKKDGSVAIMRLLDDNTTIENELSKRDIEYQNSVLYYNQITKEQIPTDRTFRDAWNHTLKVDMVKARNIHLNKLRKKRDKKLMESDIELLKAQDDNNNQKIQDLKILRQKLRDMPQLINTSLQSASTPDELKLVSMMELE